MNFAERTFRYNPCNFNYENGIDDYFTDVVAFTVDAVLGKLFNVYDDDDDNERFLNLSEQLKHMLFVFEYESFTREIQEYLFEHCREDDEESMRLSINESQFNNMFLGKKVMVYYNLHKHTFSISYQGKVILHADYVKLEDVEFRVRQGGKEKVRNQKSKNVHAFVIGTLVEYCEYPCFELPEPPNDYVVTYNPYKYDSFINKDTKEPIYFAKEVDMINTKNKIFVVR